jgi:hypothetical protein|tara:strand:- start:1120 stop:1389 length:270 start_codon:yes stop_codon:yes gene_type:complete
MSLGMEDIIKKVEVELLSSSKWGHNIRTVTQSDAGENHIDIIADCYNHEYKREFGFYLRDLKDKYAAEGIEIELHQYDPSNYDNFHKNG